MVNKWPPSLLHDIAVGVEDTQSILARHNIDRFTYDDWWGNPLFRAELSILQKQYQEQGVTFKLKAKALAEHHLILMDELIRDADVSPAVRLEALSKLTEWSDLYNKRAVPTNNTQVNADKVTINFNFDPSVT